GWSSHDRALRRAGRTELCNAGFGPANPGVLRTRRDTEGSRPANVRTATESASQLPAGPERGTSVGRIAHGIDGHSTNTGPFFSATKDDDSRVPVAEHAMQTRLGHEPRQREEGFERSGLLHRPRLPRPNLTPLPPSRLFPF